MKHGVGMAMLGGLAALCLALLLLLGLERLPVAHDLARSVGLHVAKDVRMAVDQLVGEPVENVVDGEMLLFVGHFGVKEHLQEQVAEFAGQLVPVAGIDGLEHLVGLFEGVGLDGVEGLLAVPGASAGCAQPRHDGDGALKSFACSGHRNQCK